MFENAEDLMAAIEGDYGEELQEQALAFAQEIGLVDQWIADEEAEEAGGYDEALEQEFQRVEAQIGRRLTQGEEQAMLDTLSTDDLNQGTVPDFMAEFGEHLAGARDHDAGRLHLGAEAAQRVMDENEGDSGIPQPQFQVPEYDDQGDYGSEDY